MQSRNLARKDEEPLSLGKLAEDAGPSPSSGRENALLLTGVALLVVAASMVASTLFS
ncbi:hypothetical protein [Roseibium sp.]|uniref:hypothetical protein n=1 Tax=Roseibium sp. TaxID=1936156 RepID=UPI003A983B67